MLSLANEDEVPAGHVRRLGREIGACAHVKVAVQLGLGHGALALLPAARPATAAHHAHVAQQRARRRRTPHAAQQAAPQRMSSPSSFEGPERAVDTRAGRTRIWARAARSDSVCLSALTTARPRCAPPLAGVH